MIQKFAHNRLIRYVFVGGFSYVVEMAVLYGLAKVFGFEPIVAVSISFWVGFVVAFFLQKYVAFEHHDGRPKVITKQLLFYSLLVAWNYTFTLAVTHFFADVVSIFLLRTVVILIVTAWNFVTYKMLFKDSPASEDKKQTD